MQEGCQAHLGNTDVPLKYMPLFEEKNNQFS